MARIEGQPVRSIQPAPRDDLCGGISAPHDAGVPFRTPHSVLWWRRGDVIHHVPGLYILYCGLGPQARS